MKTRVLGRKRDLPGLHGGRGVYGQADERTAMRPLIRFAGDEGTTFLDTVEAYKSLIVEELLGEVLAPVRALSSDLKSRSRWRALMRLSRCHERPALALP
jgi:aryl-alcohol dehydrogenase-like predicted oxidoreductase